MRRANKSHSSETKSYLKIQKSENFHQLNFWYFQLIGWAIFLIAHFFLVRITRGSLTTEILSEILQGSTGFFIVLLIRPIYRNIRYQEMSFKSLFSVIAVISFIAGMVWYGIAIIIISIIESTYIGYQFLTDPYLYRWMIWVSFVVLGWSVLYFAVKIFFDWEREKKRAEEAMVLAQGARLQMLRYQLNPHFLFNSLNSVRALIDENARNAKMLITELSEFLRYSLISKNKSTVLLKEELDAIRHYLSIEKKRYEENLEITIETNQAAEEFPILSFLIHPLVENAIKHGMHTSPMPLKIGISAKYENDKLVIDISNTGKWMHYIKDSEDSPQGTGVGLENVKARLENACAGKYAFRFYERDGFVHVVIEISCAMEKKHDNFSGNITYPERMQFQMVSNDV